jgi:CDP-diacylglycerol---serine O-phosphatidyltransferase
MNWKNSIPNLFTLGNLVCGSVAVLHIAIGFDTTWAVFLIFVAAILDLFDGAIARALGVSGELGKQLDSLADVVSFGVAPSIIIFKMIESDTDNSTDYLKYLAFANAACAALRLARFNISTDQTHDFKGMPSPANGIFWASLLAALYWYNGQLDHNPSFHIVMPLSLTLTMLAVTSILMISGVRMFSFKFKPGGFKANFYPFVFLVLAVILAVVLTTMYSAWPLILPLCIILYMVLSVGYHFSLTKKNQ